jgi:hypothetical protein
MLSRIAIAWLLIASVSAGSALIAAEGEPATPARKILVVARYKEEAKRRAQEEQARSELQEKGVEVMLGSDVLTDADFASEDTIRTKVESLGVDGVLGFAVLSVEQSVKTSSASLSVGVGGYGGGPFSVFVGTTVPLGGSEPKVSHKASVRARYFARPFAAPAWEKTYKETVPADTTTLTQYLAESSVKALKKKKLIPAK